jgi:hypothetical protein
MAASVKTCNCCHASYDTNGWLRLVMVGLQEVPTPNSRPRQIELRNCACGSTLASGLTKRGGEQ